MQISGLSDTRAGGNGRYTKVSSDFVFAVDANCGASSLYIQQSAMSNSSNATVGFIVSNRNMMSGNSDNVFWIIMSDTNDITRLDVVSSINKVFNGQIIDQRGFPPFYGVMLDSDSAKSLFAPS